MENKWWDGSFDKYWKIVKNSIVCLSCNDEIESKHRHDYVTCSCGTMSVDGGKNYLKRTGNLNSYKDTSVSRMKTVKECANEVNNTKYDVNSDNLKEYIYYISRASVALQYAKKLSDSLFISLENIPSLSGFYPSKEISDGKTPDYVTVLSELESRGYPVRVRYQVEYTDRKIWYPDLTNVKNPDDIIKVVKGYEFINIENLWE